jgi:hypothetical protein
MIANRRIAAAFATLLAAATAQAGYHVIGSVH